MNSFLNAIKTYFSSVANLGTFLGLCGALFIYCLISFIIIIFEDKELAMKLLSIIQFKLEQVNNKWAISISGRLWTKIINLDYKKRCQMALHSASEEDRLWIISQFAKFEYRKEIEDTCRIIISDPRTPEKIVGVAKASVKQIKYNTG